MLVNRPEGALKAVLVSRAGRVWVDAGRLCVDLTITGPWPGAGVVGARWERLHDPADLADWLSACDVGLHRVEVGPDDLADALTLRIALWGLTRAAVQGLTRPRGAVSVVNTYAAGVPLVPHLGGGGRQWAGPTAAQALATIARDAVELYADPLQLTRLRECASNDCPRPFYDTSRAGTRRWCDPVRCGDRQRARAYRKTRRQHEPSN